MIVMTNYLLKKWQTNNKINGNQFVGSTIVSTPMMPVLANAYGVDCKIGLTGFKWIAKMVLDHPELEFIGGGEESFGYMVGDFVRDKDAITSALLACEIVAEAKANNSSFYEELLKLYVEHGFYKERLISITKKGIEGEHEIKQMMIDARVTPFETLAGSKVVSIEDYQSSESNDLIAGNKSVIDIPKSNVLIYYTEDGSKIALRPSGTEPKIKFYISVNANLNNINNVEQVEQVLENKIDDILKDMKLN
jgi:phosphomannomutase